VHDVFCHRLSSSSPQYTLKHPYLTRCPYRKLLAEWGREMLCPFAALATLSLWPTGYVWGRPCLAREGVTRTPRLREVHKERRGGNARAARAFPGLLETQACVRVQDLGLPAPDFEELEAEGGAAAGGGAEAEETSAEGPSLASSSFRDFLLAPPLLRAIQDVGFEHPSQGMWLETEDCSVWA